MKNLIYFHNIFLYKYYLGLYKSTDISPLI